IIASTDASRKTGSNFMDPDGSTFQAGQHSNYIGSVFKDSADGNYITHISAPLNTDNGTNLLIVKLNLKDAYGLLKKRTGLGTTGEIFLARKDLASKKVIYISPLTGDKKAELFPFDTTQVAASVVVRTLREGSITAPGVDYRG